MTHNILITAGYGQLGSTLRGFAIVRSFHAAERAIGAASAAQVRSERRVGCGFTAGNGQYAARATALN